MESVQKRDRAWVPGLRALWFCILALAVALVVYDLAPVVTLSHRARGIRKASRETTVGEFRKLIVEHGMGSEDIRNMNALLVRYHTREPWLLRQWNDAVVKYRLHEKLKFKTVPTSRIIFLHWGLDDLNTMTATQVSGAL